MALTKVTGGLLGNLPTGTSNVAVGDTALDSIESGAQYNVAIGSAAGTAVTTGVRNTLIGAQSGDALIDADFNVSLGYATLSSDTLGNHSTAIGYAALFAQNFTSATDSFNTAVGSNAGLSVTTGVQNTLIGALSGDALTTGNRNTALGYSALSSDTLGDRNVAIGNLALQTQNFTSSTDSYNTAVGYNAGGVISTGVQNTLIGASTGDALNTGSQCTFIGMNAGGAATTGTFNTFLGRSSGSAVTTGSKNTIIGSYNGNQYGLDIRTTGNDIVLSDGDGFPRAHFDGAETWNFSCGATNALTADRVSIDRTAMYTFPDAGTTLGYASYRWGQIYSSVGSISTSDARDKTSVTALTADEIQASKLLAKEIGTYQWLASIEEKGADNARHHVGMTVQRAIEIMESCNLDPMRYGFICYDAWEKDDLPLLEAGDRYGFRYEQLNQFLAAGFNARLEALES